MAESQDPAHLAALHALVQEPAFTLQERHFFYWQLITRHSAIAGAGTPQPAAVYRALLEEARGAAAVRAPWIPPAERDQDRVVVITNQLLGLSHAPTADCMDYCHVLQTRLGKQVLLINTADMPWQPPLPYHEPMRFNHVPEYSKVGALAFKGEQIAFYQCKAPMPNVEEVRAILGTVFKQRPAFVLSLGHSNVTPDLCADFVTVATMPFGTNLPRARSNLYLLPRRRRDEDAGVMRDWDIRDEQVIETRYTFRLPERSATFSRAQLRLPEDAYVIAIVGNRLHDEIGTDVAAELEHLLSNVPRTFIAFMGTFTTYEAVAGGFPTLRDRSVFLGHQQDVLAVYEHCDAYWNPPRYGGGSSAAFALGMGLPVLTRNSGDVANIVGERFIFESAAAIEAFVGATLADAAHRRAWREAAHARFAEISDREGMLRGIVGDVMARAHVRVEAR